MAEAVKLISTVENVEAKYGSVVKAPENDIRHLQELASHVSMGRVHSNAVVRMYCGKKTVVTKSYQLFRAWHLLCEGFNRTRIGKAIRVSAYRLKGLRHKTYCCRYKKKNGDWMMIKARTMPMLCRKLRSRPIFAPKNVPELEMAMTCYNQGSTCKYYGNYFKCYYMTPLVLRTKRGDIRAKIPLSVRGRHV